jgi:shikimate kinase
MSTGGGAPCFHDNMIHMNSVGKTIFLDVPAIEIADRLKKTNLNERPLFSQLNSEQLKNEIELLRSHRIGFYMQAKLIFEGANISVDSIASAVTN